MKPLSVIIRRPGRKGIGNESLLAGKRYDMECETTGSRPPAVITWYKGRRRQLKHTTVRKKNKKYTAGCADPRPRSICSLSPFPVAYTMGISRIFCPSAQKLLFPAFFHGSSLPFLFRHFRETLKGAGLARAAIIPKVWTFPRLQFASINQDLFANTLF